MLEKTQLAYHRCFDAIFKFYSVLPTSDLVEYQFILSLLQMAQLLVSVGTTKNFYDMRLFKWITERNHQI